MIKFSQNIVQFCENQQDFNTEISFFGMELSVTNVCILVMNEFGQVTPVYRNFDKEIPSISTSN